LVIVEPLGHNPTEPFRKVDAGVTHPPSSLRGDFDIAAGKVDAAAKGDVT
jgi:hypothetical protein